MPPKTDGKPKRSHKKKAPAAPVVPDETQPVENERRLKQTVIPGTEGVRIKELDEAADDYVSKRDARQRATVKEVESKNTLVALLHAHADELGRNGDNAIAYRYDDMLVTLTPKDEVLKVKAAPEEPTGVVTTGAPKDDDEGEA